jgi:hypothetical protein
VASENPKKTVAGAKLRKLGLRMTSSSLKIW